MQTRSNLSPREVEENTIVNKIFYDVNKAHMIWNVLLMYKFWVRWWMKTHWIKNIFTLLVNKKSRIIVYFFRRGLLLTRRKLNHNTKLKMLHQQWNYKKNLSETRSVILFFMPNTVFVIMIYCYDCWFEWSFYLISGLWKVR